VYLRCNNALKLQFNPFDRRLPFSYNYRVKQAGIPDGEEKRPWSRERFNRIKSAVKKLSDSVPAWQLQAVVRQSTGAGQKGVRSYQPSASFQTNLSYTFRRAEKLHRDKDFQQVLKSGRRLVHPAIFIYIYPQPATGKIRRLGLITSRRIGNAVQRNRLKRRLREIFRLNKDRLAPGIDIIFMTRPGAADLNYRQLQSVVYALFTKAGVLHAEEKDRS
jgi:ribonuclease P protein component